VLEHFHLGASSAICPRKILYRTPSTPIGLLLSPIALSCRVFADPKTSAPIVSY
jgi:hypothetical protein